MKAKKLSSTKNMTREQWLEIRKSGITGSRIAGIMNISPWETPRSVYLDLIGKKPEKEQTEPMYWGNVLEDVVAKEFQQRVGLKVRKVNYILQHPTFDFLLGNVDREIVDGKIKGILECKNVGAYSLDEWKIGPPLHYVTQLQFYLLLTGYQFGYLAALVGGQKFISHRVERDDEFIQQMIEAATEFWFGHVEPQIEPDITERDTELLNQVYNSSDPEKILNLSSSDESLVQDVREAKEQMDAADESYKLAVNRLKDKMRDAEMVLLEGEKIATWKPNKNGTRTFRLA